MSDNPAQNQVHIHLHNGDKSESAEGRRLLHQNSATSDIENILPKLNLTISDLKKQRTILKIIIVFVLFFTILSLSLSLWVVSIGFKKNSAIQTVRIPEENQSKILCLNFEDIKLETVEENGKHLEIFEERKDASNNKVYCAQNETQVGILINRMIERDRRLQKANIVQNQMAKPMAMISVQNETSNEVKVTEERKTLAHLLPVQEQDKNDDQQHMMKWHYDAGVSIRSNVLLKESKYIIVPETGYYYIYSQIYYVDHFEKSKDEKDGRKWDTSLEPNQGKTLKHTVERHHISYKPEDLMSHQQSKYVSVDEEVMEYTSYLGAVHYLRAQDLICVTVTHPNLVRPDQKNTFFGLYKV